MLYFKNLILLHRSIHDYELRLFLNVGKYMCICMSACIDVEFVFGHFFLQFNEVQVPTAEMVITKVRSIFLLSNGICNVF